MMKQSQARGDWVSEIIGKYADTVFRVAFTNTQNRHDADDIFQEVFIRLFRSEVVFESDEHIKAWLIRVTINASRNLMSSAWRKKTVEMPSELPAGEQAADGNLRDAVRSLPQKYRAVIHLFYFEEMSIAEIAKTLKVKKSTIKSQLSRARDLLRKKLKNLEGGFTDV
jgi:RNA polymerase sigma-70 factor (ECF subfamily)